VVAVSVVKVVDVDGTIVVPNLDVKVRVDTALQEVVEKVTVTGKVVTFRSVLVVVPVYEVYVIPVVMFEKMNVRTTCTEVVPVTDVVVTVVVTTPCIGFIAGAIAGTRIPSAARVTQRITRALIASCLFKSVPSRCWA